MLGYSAGGRGEAAGLQQEVRDLGGGANQSGLRDHNERLVMTMVQRHGRLPGVDIARRAGLSQQTVSVILRKLETEGFMLRGEPVRGRVGKPSIPMELNPRGAFSVGLKIGRRSADLVLTDLAGALQAQRSLGYRYPQPQALVDFLRAGLDAFERRLGAEWSRVAGIGIAIPFELWKWPEALGVGSADLDVWRDVDLPAQIAAFTDLPVFVENDATAAARAEHVFGRGRALSDYVYFFVGSFIGGGVILNHSVYSGRTGNAGAFGTLPVIVRGERRQLIDAASLYLLEDGLTAAGLDGAAMWAQPQDWTGIEAHLAPWIDQTAGALASAVVSVASVLDVEAVLIDGGFPADVRGRLVAAVNRALPGVDSRGIDLPQVQPGQIGGNARAIGAACAPIFSRYLLNTLAARPVG
jgi:predicted NBD/HSP70 family sugar kinase